MGSVVVLLGPPGAGKGTQAARLARELGLPHVATGELLRANFERNTELGRAAKAYVDDGKLVPDELVVDMLFDRVAAADCAGGYLLDGFPRTLAQAEILEQRLPAGWEIKVRGLEVHDDVLVDRIAGRLACSECTNVHHASSAPPKAAGRCDVCGGSLYRRDDDAPDVARERLAVYHEQTRPVVEFYQQRGLLVPIDGQQSPDEVFQALSQSIGAEA